MQWGDLQTHNVLVVQTTAAMTIKIIAWNEISRQVVLHTELWITFFKTYNWHTFNNSTERTSTTADGQFKSRPSGGGSEEGN